MDNVAIILNSVPPWMALLAIMVGPAGLTTIVAGVLARRAAKADAQAEQQAPPPPVPVQVSADPWFIQHIVQIDLEQRNIKQAVDANTAAVNALAMQLNTAIAYLDKRRFRKPDGMSR